MKPAAKISADLIGTEEVAKRTLTSKTLDLGNGQNRLIQTLVPLHYTDGQGNLQDIDLTLSDHGGHWLLDKADYKLTVQQKGLNIDFFGNGIHSMCSLKNAPDPIMDASGNVSWAGDGFLIELTVMPHGISLKTTLQKSVVLEWTRDQGFSDETARDAKKRICEVVTGALTGNVAVQDPKTRQKSWVKDLQFPVTFQ